MKRIFTVLIAGISMLSCDIGSFDIYDPVGDYKSDDSPRIVAGFPYFTKYENPTAYIPLECYTDTGKLKTGTAFANPCYVCHNGGNTPVDNAGDWLNQIDWLRFPSNDNPWLNAVAPEKTSVYLGLIAGRYDPKNYGEYQLYFVLSNGIDHFRSNREGVCRILGYNEYDFSSNSCNKSSGSIDFFDALDFLNIKSSRNILTDPSLVGYLNPDGSLKQSLFLPSKERSYKLNGRYIQVVLTQKFVYGRDLFPSSFGTKEGGNSLEGEHFLTMKISGPGFEEEGLITVFKTFLSY